MQALDSQAIVDLWERLASASPSMRAALLYSRTCSIDVEQAWSMPIGRRDAGLLRARQALYGDLAACFVHCPQCQADLEFEVQVSALQVPAPAVLAGDLWLEAEGYRLEFRLPSSRDLLAVERCQDHAQGVMLLLRACVQQAWHGDSAITADDLPASVRAAVAQAIERLDPQARLQLELHCATCDHAWQALFDIASYLWRELEVDARRLLREVDALARAYGWNEATVLALSRQRRRTYLELVGAR